MLATPRHLIGVSCLALFCAACQRYSPDALEANKQVVRDLFAAIDAQDFSQLAELLPEDAIGHMAGADEMLSQEAVLEMIPAAYAAFPDYHHVIEELVAEGDLVAARLRYQGTHENEFEGIPATGISVTYSGMQFFRVIDGVIKEWWLVEDNLSFLSQLGMQLTPVAAGLSEKDVAAIRDLFQRFDDTANAGDAQGWMTLLSDDVLWMVPNQAVLVSKEAVHTRVQPFFDQLDMEHTTTLEEVEGVGEWAFVRGTYSFRTTPKAGGETSEEIGKFIYILGRQSDGSWRIARAIWNLDLPLPQAGSETET